MDKNAHPPRRRLLKILLASVGGLIGVVILVITGALIYLRSQAGSDQILKFAQGYLRDHLATRLEYGEGRLDPLTGLHFRNLRIVRDTAEQKLDVAIAAVDMSYSLGLSRIVLNELRLTQPRIKIFASAAQQAPPEEKKGEEGGEGGAGLAKLLESPPVNFEAKNIAVDDLEVEFEQAATPPGGRTRFKLAGLSLRTAFALVKRNLSVRGEISPGAGFELALDQKQHLKMKGGFSGKWSAGIRREGGEWIYEIEPTAIEATLTRMQFSDPKMALTLQSLKLDANLKLLAKTLELFKGSADAVKTDEITSQLVLGPLELQADGAKIAVAGQKLALNSRLNEEVHVDVDYRSGQITMPGKLARPVTAAFGAKAVIPRDLASAKFKSALKVDDAELLGLEGEARKDPDGAFTCKGQLRALLRTHLLTLVKLKKDQRRSAEKLLPLAAESDFDVQRDPQGAVAAEMALRLPALRLPSFAKPWGASLNGHFARAVNGSLDADARLEAENSEFGKWRISTRTKLQPEPLATDGHTEIAQLSKGDVTKLPLVLPSPVVIDHKVDLKNQANHATVAIDAPEIVVHKKATIMATHVDFSARSNDFKAAQNADIELSVREGAIRLDPSLGETPLPIKGLMVTASASLRDAKRVALDKFQLNLNGSMVAVSASGTGNAVTKDVQLRAETGVNFSDGLEVAGQKLQGRLTIPVVLTVFQGREANLSGGVNLQGLSWSKDKIAVAGINGRLPFSEKLVWDGKAVRFQNLITQNPFERVDFERVRPLLQGTEQVRIERISWEERDYGPFVGFVNMSQNMLNVHQFDLDLGPGRVYGEMFFDAYPANLQLGVLARMTGLDLGEILPKRFLARMQGGSKTISGRSGFVLNINRGVLDGRIDLTELGGPQLVALINTIDPAYEDEKMNKVRGLLQIGYPTALALDFKDGYMNMDVDLAVKGIPLRQSLREIPVSSLLGSVTSEIVKKTEKGPLKQ